ncbi:MAG: ATPase, T2SS/T4P/T4SS family [Patescibacteria group bacterium]
MNKIDNSQLRSFLEDVGKISPEQLDGLFREAKKSNTYLGMLLLEKKLISEEELQKLEAYILGIPFIDFAHERIDEETLHLIPESIAKKYNIIAYKKTATDLQIAMLDPSNIEVIEFIKKTTNLKILPRLTNIESIREALKQYRKSLEIEFEEILGDTGETRGADITHIQKENANGEEPNTEELKKIAEDLPIVKIVDTLIQHAILERASDIHIEPNEQDVIVRYRVDGILHDAMTLPKKVARGVVARIKVMSNLKIDEHRLPQDGRFKLETREHKVSFRVSILPIFDGEKIVIRLLPEDAKGFSLTEIGFRGDALEKVQQYIKKPTGIILVTGPTGSGKTTTLYTILDILNSPDVNISTIEDPIEYRMPRVNQTQVKPEIGLSFGSGLRALLRQDPNIIMVGEIRDEETAKLAINAALTGHLVLSTIHTNSASGTLPRLLEMGIEPFLIASTVNLIIAQRLVRRLSGAKKRIPIEKNAIPHITQRINIERVVKFLQKERVIDQKTSFEKILWSEPEKTEEVPTGYKGRIGIYEVLEVTEAIKEIITKQGTADAVEKKAREEGMITMLEDGILKAAEGVTTLEEILRVTSD